MNTTPKGPLQENGMDAISKNLQQNLNENIVKNCSYWSNKYFLRLLLYSILTCMFKEHMHIQKCGLVCVFFKRGKWGMLTWSYKDEEWIWPNHDNDEPDKLNLTEIDTDKPKP